MESGSKTILLVEDDKITSLIQSRNLRRVGYNVITEISGEGAVDKVENHHSQIDLVLMDIDLDSELNGIQAAEIILSKFKVPVLFLSSNMDSSVINKAKSVSFYGYIFKEARHAVLVEAIEMAIDLNKILIILGADYKISDQYNNSSPAALVIR